MHAYDGAMKKIRTVKINLICSSNQFLAKMFKLEIATVSHSSDKSRAIVGGPSLMDIMSFHALCTTPNPKLDAFDLSNGLVKQRHRTKP